MRLGEELETDYYLYYGGKKTTTTDGYIRKVVDRKDIFRWKKR